MLHDIEFDQERETKKVRATTPHFFRAFHGRRCDPCPRVTFSR